MKGEILTLIQVGINGRPEKAFDVEIIDKKGGVVTVKCGEAIRPGCVVSKKDAQSYSVRTFIFDSHNEDGEATSFIIQLHPEHTMDHVFSARSLTPRFAEDGKEVATPVARDTLIAWAEAGVLAMTVEPYFACPECRKVVTTRTGCRACYSSRWKSMRLLLRHRPCGYIGHGTEYANWFCPNCDDKIEMGSWDSFPEPMNCLDCGFMNSSMPFHVGTCLGCLNTHPLSDCIEMPSYRFRLAG